MAVVKVGHICMDGPIHFFIIDVKKDKGVIKHSWINVDLTESFYNPGILSSLLKFL